MNQNEIKATIEKVIKQAEENSRDDKGEVNYPAVSGILEAHLTFIGDFGLETWAKAYAARKS